MALNVILPNLSLAFSTVTFYQVARILLTPTVALMNFVLYRATLPRNAIYALIPACLGVGMVSYYDSLPAADANIKTTSTLGVIFAFTGIFASSLYTVWIASYHKKLQVNSMQLLFSQAPLAAFMLLYVIPFVDTFPVWGEVPVNRWVLIFMVRYFKNLVLVLKLVYAIWHTHTSYIVMQCQLISSFLVWLICLHYQHVPIFHHCSNWSCLEYCCWTCQDMFNCCSWMDDFWTSCWRQISNWCFYRNCWNYCVSDPFPHSTSLSLYFPSLPKRQVPRFYYSLLLRKASDTRFPCIHSFPSFPPELFLKAHSLNAVLRCPNRTGIRNQA